MSPRGPIREAGVVRLQTDEGYVSFSPMNKKNPDLLEAIKPSPRKEEERKTRRINGRNLHSVAT